MPTYQYVCGSCEEPLEIVQSFTDDALTVCPECGESSLRKVYGSVGVVFKGSGFYRTDSRDAKSATTPAKPAAAPVATSTAPASTPAASTPAASTPASSTTTPTSSSKPASAKPAS